MNLKMYYNYLNYVLEHKKNVFIECWKEGLYLHAFTHDLSKFNPIEFIPYARKFYGAYPPNAVLQIPFIINKDKIKTKEQVEEDFQKAWKHHYMNNKHHWNYWNEKGLDMPHKYIMQMIVDWKGMSRKFGDSAQEFYFKNYKKIKLTQQSRLCLEANLGLCGKWFCECNEYYWMTIEEIVKDCLEYEKDHPNNTSEWFREEYLKEYKDKYNVNLLEIFK